MGIKVYLDDERPTPDGWVRAYTPKEAIEFLKTENVEYISLDHDLGDDVGIGTGYDVLLWVEEQVFVNNYKPPIILVHTANPAARVKMLAAVARIERL